VKAELDDDKDDAMSGSMIRKEPGVRQPGSPPRNDRTPQTEVKE
jgi:hypothetical protein